MLTSTRRLDDDTHTHTRTHKQGVPRESVYASSRPAHNPYEPGYQNPYRRDSQKGKHPSYGVGEAEGDDDPSVWNKRPYNPRGVYAGSSPAKPVIRALERTPFARALARPGGISPAGGAGSVAGGRGAGGAGRGGARRRQPRGRSEGLGDRFVSPQTLAKQWHPNRSWSSKAGQGRTGFPHLPAATRNAILHGDPAYGKPGTANKVCASAGWLAGCERVCVSSTSCWMLAVSCLAPSRPRLQKPHLLPPTVTRTFTLTHTHTHTHTHARADWLSRSRTQMPMKGTTDGTWDDVVPGVVAEHLIDMDKMCAPLLEAACVRACVRACVLIEYASARMMPASMLEATACLPP